MARLHPKLAKWICWLKFIKGGVQELVIAKDMFQQVQKMIEDNPLLHRATYSIGAFQTPTFLMLSSA
ncbi:MAG: hypothetical protein ABI363_02810 [Nitrosospira sp.]